MTPYELLTELHDTYGLTWRELANRIGGGWSYNALARWHRKGAKICDEQMPNGLVLKLHAVLKQMRESDGGRGMTK